MKALTCEGWLDCGYHVIRGQKATGKNAKGESTFTREQVTEDNVITEFSSRPDPLEDVEDI